LLLTFYHHVVEWMEANMLTCPSKKWLHIECPGCGMQRSIIALLKGDFANSFYLYPATVPILFMLGFTLVHLKFRFSAGATILKYLYIGIAIVILVFYIYKIINHKITA
jgi:hypothetical protein